MLPVVDEAAGVPGPVWEGVGPSAVVPVVFELPFVDRPRRIFYSSSAIHLEEVMIEIVPS